MKKLSVFFIVFFALNILSVSSFATDSDFYSDSIKSIEDSIDESTKKILNESGLNEFSYDELYNLSFSDIADLILSVFKNNLKKPLSCCVTVVCISLLSSVANTYINKNNSIALYTESVAVLSVSLTVLSEIVPVINRTVTSVESLGVLMKTLIPVLAVIVSFSGSPALALSYNATTVYVAQIITSVCRDFLTPILIMLACVSVCFALNSIVRTESVINMVKKAVNTILGLAGTVFTGFVTIKDFLASSADRVSVKGVKFLIGSSVPVVGSALSEGLSSVIASVTLMKNTFGVVGIIVITVLTLPVVAELIIWILSLSFAGIFCEMFSQSKICSVMVSLRFVFSTFLSVVLFTTYILLVSTGLTILLGNG